MSKRFLAVILMMILTISAFAQESDATSQSGKVLTDKEVKFKEKILDKNGIDPSNKEQMHKQFKKHLTAGIVQAAVSEALLIPLGSVFTVLTTIDILRGTIGYDSDGRRNGKFAWYPVPSFGNGSYILLPIAVSMLLVGLIIDPLSAIHFIRAGRTYSIYKKTTGQRLMSFIQRTSFGGVNNLKV